MCPACLCFGSCDTPLSVSWVQGSQVCPPCLFHFSLCQVEILMLMFRQGILYSFTPLIHSQCLVRSLLYYLSHWVLSLCSHVLLLGLVVWLVFFAEEEGGETRASLSSPGGFRHRACSRSQCWSCVCHHSRFFIVGHIRLYIGTWWHTLLWDINAHSFLQD